MIFYKETNFKETPIGKIPKDWEVYRIKDVIKLCQSGIWGDEPSVDEETYPVIRSTEITHTGKLDLSSVAFRRIPKDKVDKYSLRDGDILIVASSGSPHLIGRVALFSNPDGKKYLFSNFTIRIRPERMNSKFLFYFLNSRIYLTFLKSLQQTSTGLRNLPRKKFLDFNVSFPPLLEQQKIAEILSTVDEAIQKTDEIIAKTERLKNGLMQELLTKGIGHKEFKDTEIGRMPKKWRAITLGEVSSKIKTGPFGSQLRKGELSESGIKVYTQENVLKKNFSIGDMYVSYDKFERLRDMEVRPGDVLLTIRGSVGVSAVFPETAEKGIIHTNLAIIRVKRELLLPAYLSILINDYDIVRSQITTFSSATTLGALYAKHIRKIRIPLPSLTEQRRIVEIISTVNEKLEIERNEKARLERIKRGMMDLLLTGKVRVKVN